jgi:ubiquinone/menaquinone biosynthesis C-methylase UbiE
MKFAGWKMRLADLSRVFTESSFPPYSTLATIAADKEDRMSSYASTVRPYKGLGMEGFVAKWYAALTRKSLENFRDMARRVAGQTPAGSKVLEVAPGPGYFAIELAKLGSYKITGLDISRTFVEIATANAVKEGVCADFRQGNASNMPFGDETFDFLFCCAAFKNFTEPKRALEEMYRVLRPGGRALIIDLRKDASQESINQAVENMNVGVVNRIITKMTFRFMLRKRAYARDGFEQLIAETGFHEVQIEENLIALEITLAKQGKGPGLIYF